MHAKGSVSKLLKTSLYIGLLNYYGYAKPFELPNVLWKEFKNNLCEDGKEWAYQSTTKGGGTIHVLE